MATTQDEWFIGVTRHDDPSIPVDPSTVVEILTGEGCGRVESYEPCVASARIPEAWAVEVEKTGSFSRPVGLRGLTYLIDIDLP